MAFAGIVESAPSSGRDIRKHRHRPRDRVRTSELARFGRLSAPALPVPPHFAG